MTQAGERLIASAKQAAEMAKAGADLALLDPGNLIVGMSAQIDEHYGPRCSSFDPNCATCQMWSHLDAISAGLEAAGAFES